jgi:hypothetical protein
MGIIFKAPAFLIYIVAGLWGLIICLRIVADTLGTVMAIVSLFLLPALLSIAPWYQGLWHGDWFPLALIYGGGVIATILFGIGSMIDGQ